MPSLAARSNASGTIELLARSGVDIDEKLRDGLTPLSNAARQAQAGAVRTLLELGADVNGAPDVDPVFPYTPLEEAIARGLEEIADILRAGGKMSAIRAAVKAERIRVEIPTLELDT